MNPVDEFFDEETGIQYYAIDVDYMRREDGIPVIFVEARHKIDE